MSDAADWVGLVWCARNRMEDPSERRGTTRVEKRKIVAVGRGGTTIEVRDRRATSTRTDGIRTNETNGFLERKKYRHGD